jgi:uncharacterized protein
MNTAENKKIMQAAFVEMAKGNGKLFVESFAENIAWTMLGSISWAKTYHGKQAVLTELMGPLFAKLATPFTNTATRIIAEDDIVVVECKGNATTKTGLSYQNSYCFICKFADGKIIEITEYLDTDLVVKVLGE